MKRIGSEAEREKERERERIEQEKEKAPRASFREPLRGKGEAEVGDPLKSSQGRAAHRFT